MVGPHRRLSPERGEVLAATKGAEPAGGRGARGAGRAASAPAREGPHERRPRTGGCGAFEYVRAGQSRVATLPLCGASGLRPLDERGEPGGIVDRHVGEHLAVQVDLGLLEAVHEHGVRQAVEARAGVDAGDPQLADLALLGLAVAVGVLQRVLHLLLGGLERAALGTVITMRPLEYGALLLLGADCALDPRHGRSLLVLLRGG